MPQPEVVHGVDAGGAVALGVLRGDAEAGGLLQPVGGEHHAAGELAELLDGPRAQPGLVERGRHEVRVEAGAAQPLLQGQRTRLLVRRERLQQTPAFAGGQPSQQGQVHVAHCCVCRALRSRVPAPDRGWDPRPRSGPRGEGDLAARRVVVQGAPAQALTVTSPWAGPGWKALGPLMGRVVVSAQRVRRHS